MKKILSMLPVLTIALALAACSIEIQSKDGESLAAGDSVSGKPTVTESGSQAGQPGDNKTVEANTKLNVPKDASDAEKAVWNYVGGAVETYENGLVWAENGMPRFADAFYAQAAATAGSMRLAADLLLGVAPDDGRAATWDEIAALGWGSHYPYLFEGIVLEAQGKSGADCYAKAALNPNYTEEDLELKAMAGLDKAALERLRATLMELEDEIGAVYVPTSAGIARNERNFSPAYLREQARKCLEADGNDLEGALAYYMAALSIDPFNGDNYAGPVVLYIFMEDADSALSYLNEGLFVDQENVSLNKLLESMKGVLGE